MSGTVTDIQETNWKKPILTHHQNVAPYKKTVIKLR